MSLKDRMQLHLVQKMVLLRDSGETWDQTGLDQLKVDNRVSRGSRMDTNDTLNRRLGS